MAKKRSRRRYAKKIPLGASLGLANTLLGASPAHGGTSTLDHILAGDMAGAFRRISLNLTGQCVGVPFALGNLNLGPLAVGIAISLGASKLKVNRYLSAIPLVKL